MALISTLLISALLLGPHEALGSDGASRCVGETCHNSDYSPAMLQKAAKPELANNTAMEEVTEFSSPGPGYKDAGRGKCQNFEHDKYLHGVGFSKCSSECTASLTCAGFSVSAFGNCHLWFGPNVKGGGVEWGGARCILKDIVTTTEPPEPPTTTEPPEPPTTTEPPEPPTTTEPPEPPTTTEPPEPPTTPEPSTTPKPPEPSPTPKPPVPTEPPITSEEYKGNGKVIITQSTDDLNIKYKGDDGAKMTMNWRFEESR